MNKIIKTGVLFAISIFSSLAIWAQEKDLDVDINVNKENSNWYQQPWVWIVGVAVFILLLAAILRGGKRSEA